MQDKDAYEILERSIDDVEEFIFTLEHHEEALNYLMNSCQGSTEYEVVEGIDPFVQLEKANDELVDKWTDADDSLKVLMGVYGDMRTYFAKFQTEPTVSQQDFQGRFGFAPTPSNYEEFSEQAVDVKNAYEICKEEVRERSQVMEGYGLPNPVGRRLTRGDVVFALEEMSLEGQSFQTADQLLRE